MTGKPSLAVDNTLDGQFDMEAPDKAWVTDITYIRTHEGFANLAVILDLFSRRVVGWAMQGRQTTNVVLQACWLPCGTGSRRAACCSIRTKARSSPAWNGPHS